MTRDLHRGLGVCGFLAVGAILFWLCTIVVRSSFKEEDSTAEVRWHDGEPVRSLPQGVTSSDAVRDRDESQGTLYERFNGCSSDEAKLELVRMVYNEGGYRPEDYAGPVWEYQWKFNVFTPLPSAVFWLQHCDFVTNYLAITVADLKYLGRLLDAHQYVTWDDTYREGDGIMRVYRHGPMTHAELSRTWLKMLTGRDFANCEEFNVWFESVSSRIEWNSVLRQFQVTGAGSSGDTMSTGINRHGVEDERALRGRQ